MSGQSSSRVRDTCKRYESGEFKRKRKRLADAAALGTELEIDHLTWPIKEEPPDELSSLVHEPEELAMYFESACNRATVELSNDPGQWSLPLSDSQRRELIKMGPPPISDDTYPRDSDRRHFSNFHYIKKAPGVTEPRRWLVYSPSVDKVFCFPCRLFSDSQWQLVQSGCNNWKNLGGILLRHECCPDHVNVMKLWFETESELRRKEIVVQEKKDTVMLVRSLLGKLKDVINFSTPGNETNFNGLFKLVSKYDYVSEVELVQGKLVTAVSEAVVAEIIQRVVAAKFYAILLDRHENRVSVVVRFSNETTGIVEERFIGIFPLTQDNFTSDLRDFIQKRGLQFENCRGFGHALTISYEIKNQFPEMRVFFAPSHSWNVVLRDSAAVSPRAQIFFGYVRKIFTLFCKSPSRWKLFQDNLKLTVEPVVDWECSIEAVKVLLLHFDSVFFLIQTVRNESDDCEMICDCQSIVNELMNLEFVLGLHIWYEILLRVSVITKLWDSVHVSLSIVLDHFRKFSDWVKEFRKTGFGDCMIAADQFIGKSCVNVERKKIQTTDYEIEFFRTMLDSIICNFDCRLEGLSQLFDNFGFIYDLNELKSLSRDDLLKQCKNLLKVLLVGGNFDSLAYDLHEELQLILLNLSPVVGNNVEQLLIYLVKNRLSSTAYPNAYFAISSVLSILGRGAEKSKMQVVKNNLRRGNCSDLAVLLIEADMVSEVKSDDVIKNFQNSRYDDP